jgi:tetratricopeptide (TPR) repeat protein
MDPNNAHFAYAYAVALHDAGREKAAIETLERSLNLHPYDRESLLALETYLEAAGEIAKARGYKQRLEQLNRTTKE